MQQLIDSIKTKFNITDIINQREDLSFITIPKEHAISLVTYLRDIKGFGITYCCGLD